MRGSTLIGVVAVLSAACVFTRVNPDHCANNGGNAHCARLGGDAPFCALDHCGLYDPSTNVDGCVAEEPEPQCASPCGIGGGDACDDVGEESSSSDVSAGSGSTGSTETGDGSSSSTGVPECLDATMCPSDRPFCAEGSCVTCTGSLLPDTACDSLDPERPFCVDDRCVECRSDDDCGDDAPLCSPGLGSCVACSYHEECPSGACHIAEGTCIPDFDVRYVDSDAPSGGGGTAGNPFTTIDTGLAGVGQGDVKALVLMASELPYDDAIVDGMRTVAIIGAPGSDAVIDVQEIGGSVQASLGATVYLSNIRIQGNDQNAAVVVTDGSRAWLDRVQVLENRGGIDVAQSEIRIRNSVIGLNGTEIGQRGGFVASQSTFDIVYSTIAANSAMVDGRSLRCDEGSSGTLRNSIVAAAADLAASVACPSLIANDSVVDAEGLRGTYQVIPALDTDWFVDPDAADFHLTSAAAEFAEVAVWREGDPAIDLDADSRPDVDGTADYPGADRP